MRFVGVDLAWTTRGGTVLCSIEENRVRASGRVGGDDEPLRWPALRASIADPASGAALDRAEDEIDAYVCAYTAL